MSGRILTPEEFAYALGNVEIAWEDLIEHDAALRAELDTARDEAEFNFESGERAELREKRRADRAEALLATAKEALRKLGDPRETHTGDFWKAQQYAREVLAGLDAAPRYLNNPTEPLPDPHPVVAPQEPELTDAQIDGARQLAREIALDWVAPQEETRDAEWLGTVQPQDPTP